MTTAVAGGRGWQGSQIIANGYTWAVTRLPKRRHESMMRQRGGSTGSMQGRISLMNRENNNHLAVAADDLAQAKEVVTGMVNDAVQTLATRSSEILPEGALGMEDDGRKLHISWIRPDRKAVSRNTLSGGERSQFDGAFGYAINPKAPVIIEAAEVDTDNMDRMLERLAHVDAQVIVLTCHGGAVLADEGSWNVIDVG